jgi:Ca2+-binding RTX toxin-like protein
VLTSAQFSARTGGLISTSGNIDSEATTIATLSFNSADRGSAIDLSGDTLDMGAITTLTVDVGANTTFTGGTIKSSAAAGNDTGTITLADIDVGADATFAGLTLTAGTITTLDFNAKNYANLSSAVAVGGSAVGTLNLTLTGDFNYYMDTNDLARVANATGGLDVGATVLNGGNGTSILTYTASSQVTKGTLNFSGTTGTVFVNLAAATGTGADALVITGGSNVKGDTLIGAGANDTISGGDGNDSLTGGSGADSLVGGTGNDIITGGAGADIISGGAGNDTFVYTAASESSVTTGTGTTLATVGIDTVTLEGTDTFQFGAAVTAVSGSGAATAVAVGASGTATTGTALATAIAAAITEAAGTAFLIQVTDSGTGGTFSGTYLVYTTDGTFSDNDYIVRLTGTSVSSNDTIAISGGNVVYTIVP